MKILLIFEHYPFPVTNGKDLPVFEYFSRLAQNHEVTLLIPQKAFDKFAKQHEHFKAVFPIALKKIPAAERILNEISGAAPSYLKFKYNRLPADQIWLDAQYDVIWTSPASLANVSLSIKSALSCSPKLALGVNDVKYNMYIDKYNEHKNRGKFSVSLLIKYYRGKLMMRSDANLMAKFDLIHLQTLKEQSFALKALPKKHHLQPNQGVVVVKMKPEILVLGNAIKSSLKSVTYHVDATPILFMTHLNQGRKSESAWFLQNVWPLVIQEEPDLKLWLVGSPPEAGFNPPYLSQPGVIVKGYAADLNELFSSIRLAVVPTFHGTGLINRIQDALVAGVPVITTPQAASTIDQFKESEHGYIASDAKTFAKLLISTYRDKELLNLLSTNAVRDFNNLPDWDATTKKLEQTLINL
jgi:Glycosyl transferases group 1